MYGIHEIKESERIFLNRVVEEGASVLSWGSPSTANTSKYRIIPYLEQRGIWSIRLKIRDSILCGYYDESPEQDKSTIIHRLNTPIEISIDEEMEAWLIDQLKRGLMSQAEFAVRLEDLWKNSNKQGKV